MNPYRRQVNTARTARRPFWCQAEVIVACVRMWLTQTSTVDH